MSETQDLSRWNRAGLKRFQYIDVNAAKLLELLRQLMVEEFTDQASGELKWSELETVLSVHETSAEKNDRLLEQYQGERRDYAWEIMRSFSRSLHVLLEHLNTYANEGYIGTATQWDNVRKLVNMLDYHPAPAASAYCNIALIIKQDQEGTVDKGWQVKNAPEDGSAPLIFETLEDIDVSSDLNRLYLDQWNVNLDPLSFLEDMAISPHPLAFIEADFEKDSLSAGSRGICLIENQAGEIESSLPVVAEKIESDSFWISGLSDEEDYALYQLTLLFNSDFLASPRIYGDTVIELDQAFNNPLGTVLAWNDGGWHLGKVAAVEENRIMLAANAIPAAGSALYLLQMAGQQTVAFDGVPGDYVVVPDDAQRRDGKVWAELPGGFVEKDTSDDGTLEVISDATVEAAYYMFKSDQALYSVKTQIGNSGVLAFSGKAKGLASGQWLLCKSGAGYLPLVIEKIESYDGGFDLHPDYGELNPADLDPVTEVAGIFQTQLRIKDYKVNQTIISGSILELNRIPDNLKRGRTLIIQCGDLAHEATVTEMDRDLFPPTITIEPELPEPEEDDLASAYLSGNTVIYANVVAVGHGESKPAKVLGSGDATKSRQSFVFETQKVSFVSDPEMNSGVRADISVSIDGRTWQQKSSLNYSAATDPHYVVRVTEDGYLKLIFGDGEKARRLPSGRNNIRITYRVGTGLGGNLSAASLVKAVKPHSLIESHLQALATSGGNSMESVSSIRDTAAARLMTFERAVSLRDFISLAANHSSVWQASAIQRNVKFARYESVEVVVVPAGGGEVTQELKDQLSTYLSNAALPGVKVSIEDYQAIEFYLDISIRVKYEEYDHEEVKLAVIAALKSAFSLAHRKLGQAIYRSEVYKVVEEVSGVENSDCVIEADTVNNASPALNVKQQVIYGKSEDPANRVIKSIRPTDKQIIVISDTESIAITPEPWEP